MTTENPTLKVVHRPCGILFSNDVYVVPDDPEGCLLPHGHEGPHEFRQANGKIWQWETDWSCNCEHCQEGEGDYCTIYWQKK